MLNHYFLGDFSFLCLETMKQRNKETKGRDPVPTPFTNDHIKCPRQIKGSAEASDSPRA